MNKLQKIIKINENRAVFLDFDGVLFNTVKESYAVTCIAQKKYNSIDEINFNLNHYQFFLKYRYLVGPAWNYKYIWELLNKKDVVSFECEYIDLISKAKIEEYIDFENLFFDTRKKLQNSSYKKWLNLNQPYEFLELIRNELSNNKSKFIIVTTKDKNTVQKLLKLENICINDTQIYDKDDFCKYKNKANIINNIIKTNNITNAIFIDDSKKHLVHCNKIKNLELCQAGWGYVSNLDKDIDNVDTIINKIKQIIG